jgi:lysophospholipase L1-like esterase
MSKLFFIGDSITCGAWDSHGGWASRLISQLMDLNIQAEFKDSNFYCLPYNLGVSGDTTEDVLSRIHSEIKGRISSAEEKIEILFAIGINDSIIMTDTNKPRYTDAEFTKNLLKLIEVANDFSARFSFIGLTPANEYLVNPMPWAPNQSYNNTQIKKFEDIIAESCKNYAIPFLSIFDTWITRSDYKNLLSDGVHPNTEGHEFLTQQIQKFLITEDFLEYHS